MSSFFRPSLSPSANLRLALFYGMALAMPAISPVTHADVVFEITGSPGDTSVQWTQSGSLVTLNDSPGIMNAHLWRFPGPTGDWALQPAPGPDLFKTTSFDHLGNGGWPTWQIGSESVSSVGLDSKWVINANDWLAPRAENGVTVYDYPFYTAGTTITGSGSGSIALESGSFDSVFNTGEHVMAANGGTFTIRVTALVSTTQDGLATPGSLRNVIDFASPNGTIRFDPSLDGQTITLTEGELFIDKPLTIDASNLPCGITIDAGQNSRVLRTAASTSNGLTLVGLTLTNGRSPEGATAEFPSGDGGGIHNTGNLTLRNCTLSDSETRPGKVGDDDSSGGGGHAGNGGGIYHSGGTLTLEGCTLANNAAGRGGNGFAIFDDVFGGNGGHGGGIYHASGVVQMTNSTLSGNRSGDGGMGDGGGPGFAGNGGGIYSDGTLSIVHGTLTLNTAARFGGGIAGAGNHITIENTVIAGNTAASFEPNFPDAAFATLNGTNFLTGDPMLEPLANNGGRTPTHYPEATSPLLNAATGSTGNDQRDCPRPTGSPIDIGAVEISTFGPIYVDANVIGGSADGSSWANAHRYLQDAITKRGVDTIHVAAGTYFPDEGCGQINNSRASTFLLRNGLEILGGFPSGGGAIFERNPEVHHSILSGDIGAVGSDGDNAQHVVTTSHTDATAVLDGVTITKGHAYFFHEWDDVVPESSGGGIFNRAGSPAIRNCLFKENVARYGAGMFNHGGAPTITGCTFSDHGKSPIAILGGGGLCFYSAQGTVTDCHFNHNRASGGGAISVNGSSITATRCTFRENECILYGGGALFLIGNASAEVKSCLFEGNTAPHSQGTGGAARTWYISDPFHAYFERCTFRGNHSTGGGGAVWSDAPTAFDNCLFQGNSSDARGGAIVLGSSSPVLGSLLHCSFQGNRSSQEGGAVYYQGIHPGSIYRSVIWNNQAQGSTTGLAASIHGPTPDIQQSLIQGFPNQALNHEGLDGTDPNVDPLFASEMDPNKAPAQLGDLRLRPGSPLINACDLAFSIVTEDLAGNPRIMDGRQDIGAYEAPLAIARWCRDDDGDGLPYGVEQAIGTNPDVADAGGPLELMSTLDNTGDPIFQFGHHPLPHPGTHWVLKRSTDMVNFTEILRYGESNSGIPTSEGSFAFATDPATGITYFTVSDPTAFSTRVFYQLCVEWVP